MILPIDIGITQTHFDAIQSIISSFTEIKKVIVFGSRAKGDYKPNSDIDLAIIGDTINANTVVKLSALFAESTIPFKVDVVHYSHNLPIELREHIDRVGKVLL